MKAIKIVIVLCLFSPNLFASDRLVCKFVYPIMQAILDNHFIYNNPTIDLEVRSIEGYIKSADPGKVYFLQEDVQRINELFRGIFVNLKSNKCTRLHSIHYIYTRKISDRYNFVRNFLNESYAIDRNATLLIDYDAIPIPTNQQDSDDLFKKRIHLQIANLISAGVELNKAKELVIKRYERIFNSVKDIETSELYSQWLYIFSRSLDPHTNFLSAPDVDNFQLQMKLAYEGIGAVLTSQEGYVVVDRLINGGAADVSGLVQAQDKIVAVAQGEDGEFEPVIDVPLDDVVQLIRGPKGTTVRLKILRQESGKSVSMIIPLVRAKIKLEEDAAKIRYIQRDQVKLAILELPGFYKDDRINGRSSSKDVDKLLKEANKKNVDGLVLDFSSNGGGLLDESIKIAGLFLAGGNIVKTVGNSENRTLPDENNKISFEKPMVILNSRFTASASEIVSGALQSYRRAVIVGADHTFGKGTFQTMMPFHNNIGNFKVTSGMFYIPNGQSTQYQGVPSDIVLPTLYSVDSIGEKSLTHSLPGKELKPFLSDDEVSGAGIWKPITEENLEILKTKSTDRVSKNEKFAEIIDELANTKKEIKLSDILSTEEEQKQNKDTSLKMKTDREFRESQYLSRPHLQEALNVLVDLIELHGN